MPYDEDVHFFRRHRCATINIPNLTVAVPDTCGVPSITSVFFFLFFFFLLSSFPQL